MATFASLRAPADARVAARGARATPSASRGCRLTSSSRARRGGALKAYHGGGAGGEHHGSMDDNASSATQSWNSQQVVESLAKTFLGGSTAYAAARRDISTRAWLCDMADEATSEECATSRRRIIKAREMEVKNGVLRSSPRPSGAPFLKELELYATLRRHESAVVVAQLKRPTILTDETSGESVVFVDAENLAMDDHERSENDALLANYCLTCPLRSGDETMCGFECAIRSRIEARSKTPLTTYRAAVFSTKAGDLEEFLITSTSSGSHTTRRAKFSNELREKLGIDRQSLVG